MCKPAPAGIVFTNPPEVLADTPGGCEFIDVTEVSPDPVLYGRGLRRSWNLPVPPAQRDCGGSFWVGSDRPVT